MCVCVQSDCISLNIKEYLIGNESVMLEVNRNPDALSQSMSNGVEICLSLLNLCFQYIFIVRHLN